MATALAVRHDGPVAWFRLDGDDRRNALASNTLAELGAALLAAERDGATRAIVVHGSGRGFSAGADIEEIAALPDPAAFGAFLRGFTDVLAAVERSPLPVVAALHGVALGGGLELAMACDLRLCTADTWLGLPEAQLGMLPGAGGTQRLPRLVPAGVAREMLLLGGALDGRRAHQVGLVNRLSPAETLLEDAAAVAAQLCASTPELPRQLKSLLADTAHLTAQQGIERERAVAIEMFTGGREGFAAFLQRRAAGKATR